MTNVRIVDPIRYPARRSLRSLQRDQKLIRR